MEPVLKPIHEILQLHINLFKISTADVSQEDAMKQLNDKGNPIIHLAGHIVSSRFMMGTLTGLPEQNPFGKKFDGTYDASVNLPSLKEVTETFHQITPKLLARLQELSSSDLEKSLPQRFPTKEQNVLAGLSFLAEHEGYHLGQIGYLRVQLGYTSIYDIMFADA